LRAFCREEFAAYFWKIKPSVFALFGIIDSIQQTAVQMPLLDLYFKTSQNLYMTANNLFRVIKA
jgi:hypothetical protein